MEPGPYNRYTNVENFPASSLNTIIKILKVPV